MKASCSKCGKTFPSRKAAVPHMAICQKGWNPSMKELLK